MLRAPRQALPHRRPLRTSQHRDSLRLRPRNRRDSRRRLRPLAHRLRPLHHSSRDSRARHRTLRNRRRSRPLAHSRSRESHRATTRRASSRSIIRPAIRRRWIFSVRGTPRCGVNYRTSCRADNPRLRRPHKGQPRRPAVRPDSRLDSSSNSSFQQTRRAGSSLTRPLIRWKILRVMRATCLG